MDGHDASRRDASRRVFDRLLDEAEPALLAGTHRRETPPVDGGRWPVSIVAVPDAATRELLAGLMADAERHAGPGHLRTGRTDASHLTLRALEPYRHAAAPDEVVLDRLTLARYRHTTEAGRGGVEQHMALEAWHEVALEGPA